MMPAAWLAAPDTHAYPGSLGSLGNQMIDGSSSSLVDGRLRGYFSNRLPMPSALSVRVGVEREFSQL
jgi:hypothetical protein